MTAVGTIPGIPVRSRARAGGIDPRVAALSRILRDESGVDLAEFAMKDYSRTTTRWFRCPTNPKHYIVAGTRPDPKNEPHRWDEPDPCQQCAQAGIHQPLVAMNKGGVHTRCYRLRPYQVAWFRCKDSKQIDSCGRSVGKSERAKLRVAAFPFRHRGQEMVLVAPLGKHVDALTQRIEPAFANTRILREMLKGGSTSTGINHRPFAIHFANGSHFFTRLPGHDGQGVKGIHPVVLEVDEGQDINERTWDELPETVRWDLDGAMMIVHGVTTGERNRFHRMTYSPESGFTWHRYTRVHGSDWTPEVRRQQIEAYNGSAEDPGYLRNVLGEPGGMANRIFLLANLERGKDDDPNSYYNTVDYCYRAVTPERIRDAMPRSQRASDADSFEAQAEALVNLIDLPEHHLERYKDADIWMGADIGFVDDPTEIMVVANYQPSASEAKAARAQKLWMPDEGESLFKVIGRFHVKHIDEMLQEELVIALIEHYQPRAFAMDKTGNGLPLWQRLEARAGRSAAIFEAAPDPETATPEQLSEFATRRAQARAVVPVIQGYNFSSKILVDIDADKLAELLIIDPGADLSAQIEYAGVWEVVKDRATDVLRGRIVDMKRLRLPADDEIVSQMNGQKMRQERNTFTPHGKRRAYSEGIFHILDAMRMWSLAWSQQRIERLVAQAKAEKAKPQESVVDIFG